MIQIKQKEYRGWKNAYALSNSVIELIVLADVGPRIVHYSLCGGENQFHELTEQRGLTGSREFRLYGGHRLWVWPEVESTYFPDNVAVEVAAVEGGLRFIAPIEGSPPGIGFQKEIEVRLAEDSSHVCILHTLSNCGKAKARIAPWTPTLLRPGGRAILPFPPRIAMDKDHFQSVGPLTLWSFTDLSDARWKLGGEFLQLEQHETPSGRFPEQMTGLFNPAEWGAYFRSGSLFVKRAGHIPGATYPDYGCNFEVFTNPDFLELETLGPIVELVPGQSTQHEEDWWLFGDVPAGESDSWIHASIVPLVEQTRNQ